MADMMLGFYNGDGADGVKRLLQFSQPLMGRRPDIAVDFLDRSSWTNFKNDATWAIPAWTNIVPNLSLAVPLTVNGTPLKAIAAGRHDYAFKVAAKILRNSGFENAIIRLGPEANGGYFPWKAQGVIPDYIAAFQHVVNIFRGYQGCSFTIDWCTAAQWQQIGDKEQIYPGDDFVDIISMDVYAEVWGVDRPNLQQVQSALTRGWSLDWLFNFAATHKKPWAFPELGVGDCPQDGQDFGPGDNGDVMAWLVEQIKANEGNCSYIGYWDYNAGDDNDALEERPNVAAALKALWA